MDTQFLQNLKNRYDIIGNDSKLNRSLEVAVAVAPTDLTVLIVGESGAGKENIPKIIHQNSRRKTGKYFAVNCGAIPEGTVDSELFGHEKGAFTGAGEMRRGYFEEADGGTLFLDEVGELPLASQAKLLRVLQDGEFLRVGSSKVLKTDVRVVAATNVDLSYAVQRGKFRQDLFYRLNAVTVKMPSLRERREDIPLLFRKFTSDFSQKYGMARISLSPDAVALLQSYRWPGNVRQLKNVAETVSALEGARMTASSGKCEISAEVLSSYMPGDGMSLPAVVGRDEGLNVPEKEMLVRMIYSLRQEVDYLKAVVSASENSNGPKLGVPLSAGGALLTAPGEAFISAGIGEGPLRFASAGIAGDGVHIASAGDIGGTDKVNREDVQTGEIGPVTAGNTSPADGAEWQDTEVVDLSLDKVNKELIRKALERNGDNRKAAARELGISERTLYRKIKDLNEKTH